MKRILIPGISPVQADFIRVCREKGFEVFTCANSARGPGRELSDGFELIDITDTAGVLGYARRIGADLVYTVGSDVAMPTVCLVSEELGLPRFISSETAAVCSNKALFRTSLGDDFPGNLRFQVLEHGDEKVRIPFPVMMKPVDSQGQRGVRPLDRAEDIPALFPGSASFSRSGKVIVEEFVDGPEVNAVLYLVQGKIRFLMILDRIPWSQFPGGILHKLVFPSSACASPALRNELDRLIERALRKLNIDNGPVVFQVRISSGGIKIIEIFPRIGGAHTWRFGGFTAGHNSLHLLLDHLLGIPPGPECFPVLCPLENAWEVEFFCDFPGTPFDPAKFDPSGAEYLEWYYAPGEKIRRVTGFYEKVGYMIRKYSKEKTGQTAKEIN